MSDRSWMAGWRDGSFIDKITENTEGVVSGGEKGRVELARTNLL